MKARRNSMELLLAAGDPIDESAGLRAELEEAEGAQSEAEHGGASTPLEADDPELEHDHPGASDDELEGGRHGA